MAELQLRGVNKSFGTVPVIKNVDLDVGDGEFVVFVGPSGCGKSTLLRTISGLEEPTSGQVFIGGEDVTDYDPSERGVDRCDGVAATDERERCCTHFRRAQSALRVGLESIPCAGEELVDGSLLVPLRSAGGVRERGARAAVFGRRFGHDTPSGASR